MNEDKKKPSSLEDKMIELFKSLIQLSEKRNELVRKIELLHKNIVPYNIIASHVNNINRVENINLDCTSEELLVKYIAYAKEMEAFMKAFIDELEKHYKDLFQNAENSNTIKSGKEHKGPKP